MNFLKKIVCSDIFNIILSYHDPIAELQKHRKRILYWVFKMSEPVEAYPIKKCEEWLLSHIKNIKDTRNRKDMEYTYGLYRSEIWEKRVRTFVSYYPDLI